MPKATVRKDFPGNFNWVRFQLILALLAIGVQLVFWLLHLRSNTLGTFVYTFVCGNVSQGLILVGLPLFAKQSRPWNWIGFVSLLFCTGVVANILAQVPIYFLFHFGRSLWSGVLEDAPFGMLVTVVVGTVAFAFDQSRADLEARNQQLQSEVQLGLTEKQSHQTDLQQAHDIQVHLLPRETPQIPGFQIACAWQPARTVSGDYFDVLPLAKDKLGLCIADVSGKGMAASLLMANLQASVKAFTQNGGNPSVESPAELCAKLNTALCNNIAPGRFVTFFYGILSSNTRAFKYENAGHCLPLLVHADGAIEFPAAYSGVLGLFSHWTYSDHELPLASGDVLVLMTDGVLEASNDEGEEFGYQRLIASVSASRGQGVHAIRQRVLADVTAFCSNNFQDDASLIVVTVD